MAAESTAATRKSNRVNLSMDREMFLRYSTPLRGTPALSLNAVLMPAPGGAGYPNGWLRRP